MRTFEAIAVVKKSSSSLRALPPPPPRDCPELNQADWWEREQQEKRSQLLHLHLPLNTVSMNEAAASVNVSTNSQPEDGGTAAVKRSGDVRATAPLLPCLAAAAALKTFAIENTDTGVHRSRYLIASLCEGMCRLRRVAVWLAVLVAWSLFSVAEAGCAIWPDTTGNVVILDSATSIADNAFSSCTALKTVTFSTGSNLTTIGDSAFSSSGLTTLTIPDSVTAIGDNAFYSCAVLTTVKFGTGSNLTTIGSLAFMRSGLTTLTIPDSVSAIGYMAFSSCTALKTVTFGTGSNLTTIGDSAFSSSGLTTLTIPDSVTAIGDNAFTTCTALKTVTFSTGMQLTSIGDGSFSQTGLTELTIPDSVTLIGLNAFYQCISLKSVTFSRKGVLIVGSNAFFGCGALTTVYIICGTKATIGSNAFLGIGLSDLRLPPTVTCNGCGVYSVMQCATCANVDINGNVVILSTATQIGPSAFNNCEQLTSVTFELDGSQLATIYDGAFSNTGITSLTLPQSLQSIGSRAFSGCKNLKSVSFLGTSQLGVIGAEAFAGSGLVSFSVPVSARQIQQNAFANSASLLTGQVSIPCGCNTTLEGNVFAGSKVTSIALPPTSTCVNCGTLTITALTCVSCNNVTSGGLLTVPANVTSISSGSFRSCASLTTIAFASGSQLASISSDAFRSCPNLRSILPAIPKSVTAIGDRAFYNCTNLNNVEFEAESGLQTIGQSAFQQTALQVIRLPETLRVISDGAFSGSNLTSIVFQNSAVSQLSSIGDFAFQLCASLTAISIPASVVNLGSGTFRLCGKLQSAVFESDSRLQSIGANAFQSTSVSSMSLPAILTSIGSYAFSDCSALSSVVLDCGSSVAIAANAFFSSGVQAISLTRGSSCVSCGAVVSPAVLTCTPSQSPTQAPTVVPEINVDRSINFDVSAKTVQQVAIVIALLLAALGAYYVNLRKADKSVVAVSMPSVAILTGLIGGEVVTSIALLADIFNSKYSGWGFVIAAMRLGHVLIAMFILYSIFGSASVRACTGLHGYLASDHMLQNRKMYALASIFTVFNISAFVMLPWKTSPFAAKAQGLPSPGMFRIVHRTEIVTGVLSIFAQVPYLSNKDCASNANCIENVTFFYANIALRSLQLLVAVVTYIMCAGLLEGTATSLDVDASKDNTVDKGMIGSDGGDVEMNAIATRNPISTPGASAESSAKNASGTRVARSLGQEAASENEPLTRKVAKVESEVKDLREQYRSDVRELQEQFKRMQRRLGANESAGLNSHAPHKAAAAVVDAVSASASSSEAGTALPEQQTGLVSSAIKKFSGGGAATADTAGNSK